jgi:hypothetical protein
MITDSRLHEIEQIIKYENRCDSRTSHLLAAARDMYQELVRLRQQRRHQALNEGDGIYQP